jgi:hypothetical protein
MNRSSSSQPSQPRMMMHSSRSDEKTEVKAQTDFTDHPSATLVRCWIRKWKR